jgi:tetratricopeptide (TPR) repeat protein/DNA-binding CsgD family transcriptional regulator
MVDLFKLKINILFEIKLVRLMKKLILIFLLIVPEINSFAQDQIKIDSLKVRLESESNSSNKVTILKELASITSKNNLYEAVDYSKQALEIAKHDGNKKLIANSYTEIASYLIFIGSYDESIMYFIEALKIGEELGDNTILFPIYHNIGVLKDRLQQFDEALDFFFKALAILDKNLDNKDFTILENQYPTLYNNIGNIYETKSDYKAAKEYYLKAYNLAKGKNIEVFGTICNNLGKLGIEMSDYENAYKYLTESLEFRSSRNDQHGVAKTYIFMALYYKEIKQFDKAVEYADKALKIGKEINVMLVKQNSVSLLSDIFYEKKDFKNSLDFFRQFKEYNDSLLNDKNYSDIAKLQLQYEHEIEKKENQVKQQRIRFRFIIILSSLILGLIIITLLFVLSRSRIKRIRIENEKLENEMNLKNKELTTNVMYLLKKNELIDNITQRLLSFKSKLPEENKQLLQKIIFDLQSITEKEVWEEFEMRFQNVHEDFYKNLKQKFPDLTPSEIKLAAFLRLNMTTKDIASITGQNINTLETARYRLRKKLGITNQEVNLVNFLLNI